MKYLPYINVRNHPTLPNYQLNLVTLNNWPFYHVSQWTRAKTYEEAEAELPKFIEQVIIRLKSYLNEKRNIS